MIHEPEIKKRLNGVIDLLALDKDRERMSRYVIDRLIPEVKRLIQEEVRASRHADRKN